MTPADIADEAAATDVQTYRADTDHVIGYVTLLPAVPPSAMCWKPLGLFDNASKATAVFCAPVVLPPEHAKTERSVAAASGICHQGLKSIGCVIDCRSAVKSAWNPVAVFLAPVVFAASAPVPVAVLLLPVVLLTSALLPMVALNPRTVLLCSALKAGGCIADISRVRKGCGITGRYGKAALCIAEQCECAAGCVWRATAVAQKRTCADGPISIRGGCE